jgi:tetratricopeptide (TPR) repeat protein
MKSILATVVMFMGLAAYAQDKPLKPAQLYARAEAAYDDGDYKKTVEYLNQCLQLEPGYADAYFMRGGAKEQLRDYKGALTDYNIFLERRVDHREGLFNRGLMRYQLKQYDLAREDFERLLILPPGETQTIYFNRSASINSRNPVMTAQSQTTPLILNYLGMIDLRQKHFMKAISWLDSAIELNPKDADYYVNRALAKQNIRDSVGALNDYQSALKINPQHTLALHNLAVFKDREGNTIDQAIESDSTVLQPFLERGQLRMKQGDLHGALADFSKALALEDKDSEIWFSRGLVRERLQDFQGAFSDYTQSIELKEDHFKGWINRANVLLKMQRYHDAIEDYTVALVYQPDYAAAYYNRAIAKNYLKESAGACEDLNTAESLGMKVEPGMKELFCKKE